MVRSRGQLAFLRVEEIDWIEAAHNHVRIHIGSGVNSHEKRLLFTGDAGTKALACVSAEWRRLLYLGVPHHASDGNLSQADIERFCPQFAVISAKGDSSHPSRCIVSGLVKVGATVGSTHEHGHLHFYYSGNVSSRSDYGPIEPLKGTGSPVPVLDWEKYLSSLT